MSRLSAVGALAVLASSLSCAGEGRVARTAVAARPDPTEAGKAAEWQRLTWRSERGEAQPGDWLQADAQLRAALALKNLHLDRGLGPTGALAQAPRVAGLEPADWSFRGPNNVGGRVRSILIDPRNASRILAGSVSGGLWESLDAGSSWQPIGDDLPNLAVGSLAFDPLNPDTIYLGTGEGQFNSDAIRGAGIFKSVDNGLTWSLLSPTAGWESVNRIAVSRQNPARLLASTRYGGIERSTDAGATWSLVLSNQGSFDVEFDPANDQNAVADLLGYDFGLGNWFHEAQYSRNGGATWNVASPPGRKYGFDARIELAYARSDPAIVYASIGNGNGIWRSSDGGATFTQTSSFSPGGWYYDALWVDPTNPALLVVGGYSLHRSVNSGADFVQISDGYLLTEQPHPDQHWVVEDTGYDGTGNRRVYVGNDGGVFRASDIATASSAAGWESLNSGLATTQYYSGKVSSSGFAMGGLQDNGTLSLATGSATAFLTFGGDGTSADIDARGAEIGYGSYVGLDLFFRAVNDGQNIEYICGNLSECGSANFIPPFTLDLNDRDRLLAGAQSLWVADNARTGSPPTWRAIRPADSQNVAAIGVAPGHSNQIWVGLNDGRVYKTTNGTDFAPTWQTIDDNGATNPLPNRFPNTILVDWRDPARVWIAFGGFAADNVQLTQDGGVTWQSASGSGPSHLPSAPVRALAQHPGEPSWLYAGTEVGLFVSANGGGGWDPQNRGPVNVAVDELSFATGTGVLCAATHGRGLWTNDTQLGWIFVDGFESGGAERWTSGPAGPGSCSHDLCTAGTPLAASCSLCAAQLCAIDASCCTSQWDATCIGEVQTVCGHPAC